MLAGLTMRTGPAADEIQAQSPQLDPIGQYWLILADWPIIWLVNSDQVETTSLFKCHLKFLIDLLRASIWYIAVLYNLLGFQVLSLFSRI